ncbi:MAG TPA: carbohydrate kinase [Ktedonobacterales bacterium]|jgi:fructokinase
MFDVLTLGECLIDLVATAPTDSLYHAEAFTPKPGGAPANVAVGVQRLGKKAAFIGKVGSDDFGRGLRQLLEQEGVATQYLLTEPASFTTLALVALTSEGEPHFTFAVGAHAELRPSDLDSTAFANTRVLHIGSVSLAHEPMRSTTLAALKLARNAGAICSYDVNWRPALWPDAKAGLALAREPLGQVDICKMNLAELRLLTGQEDAREGLAALETAAPLVVVTRGPQGCLFRLRQHISEVAAPQVATVVDSIGAGDAFMAALLAFLPAHPNKLSPEETSVLLRLACQAAALSVTRRGAIPSLPYAHEIT